MTKRKREWRPQSRRQQGDNVDDGALPTNPPTRKDHAAGDDEEQDKVVATSKGEGIPTPSGSGSSQRRQKKKNRRKKKGRLIQKTQEVMGEDGASSSVATLKNAGDRVAMGAAGNCDDDGAADSDGGKGLQRSGGDSIDDVDRRISRAAEPVVNESARRAAATASAAFPFEVDPDDHCESPIEAYQDLAHLLRSNAVACRAVTPTIYDPYYCNGAVMRNLNQLGFPNVYNRNEDCYKVWSTSRDSSPQPGMPRIPDFDVLVTNPPYSSDHVEKLLEFVTSPTFGDRPWFLLMPNWVVKKDYYDRLVLSRGVTPFYVVPHKRYVYLPPPQYRVAKVSDTHKKSSPFVSMWYVWGGTSSRTDALIREFYRNSTAAASTCDLARSKSALRDLRRKKR